MDATATDRDIDAALAATGLDASARLAARGGLDRIGYVRRPPRQLPPVVRGAGIPSLLHVLDQAALPAMPGGPPGSRPGASPGDVLGSR